MKHKYIFSVLLLIVTHFVQGQNSPLMGQYFKIMPAYAPALTGANRFFDIKAGTKNQSLVGEQLQTNFFSANGILINSRKYANKYNSHRVRDMSTYDDMVVRIGLGGYLISEELGEVRQMTGAITPAVHVPISKKAHISMGISIGFNSTRIDPQSLTVRDPDLDRTFLDYLASGFVRSGLKIDYGLALYSDRHYLSYSLMMTNLGASESEIQVSSDRQMAHHIVGGYSFLLNSKFEITPNFHARKVEQFSFLLDMGARVRYKRNTYVGISYRTNQTLIFMLGFIANDLIDVGYAFESAVSSSALSNAGSHEIVLGIRLFNHGKYVPVW